MARSRFTQIVVTRLREARGRLLVATLCMLGVAGTELLAPWPVKLIFDHVLLDKELPASLSFLAPLLGRGGVIALVVFSLAMVAIAFLRGSLAYSQLYLTSRIGNETVHALRRELFAHLQRLSPGFHARVGSGELLTKVAADTNTVKNTFTESVLTSALQLLTVLGMFAVMFALNWRLAIVVLATLPVLVWALLRLYREIKASARRQRDKEGRVVSRINQMLMAIPLVQAYGRERYEVERFEAEGAQILNESIGTARMEAAATRSVELISALSTWAALLFGAFQVLNGAMTPGELLVFTAYLTGMYKPIRNLARLSTRFSKAMVSAHRIAEVLEVEPDVRDTPEALQAPPLAGRIAFDRVSFDYGAGRDVLREVSFAVVPGQTVALLGSSGVGKSTIATLLLRFYDPRQGRILIDGTDIRRYTLASLRDQIAVVLQESVLFGAPVWENIAYGKPGATGEEIEAAARAANAHDFILALEHGYDTIIGERGSTLSGGQRRRIAIARALVRNAPILVLDEPMAGLDIESEAQVRDALRRLMAGKTCLLITHDLATAAEADWVLLLSEGRLVAQGPHEELLVRSPQYRRLQGLARGCEELPPGRRAGGALRRAMARQRVASARHLPVA